jgi:hypothetical protein
MEYDAASGPAKKAKLFELQALHAEMKSLLPRCVDDAA